MPIHAKGMVEVESGDMSRTWRSAEYGASLVFWGEGDGGELPASTDSIVDDRYDAFLESLMR